MTAQQSALVSNDRLVRNITVDQVKPNEFKPIGFTNTMTNADFLLTKTMRADPADIDRQVSSPERVDNKSVVTGNV